MGVLFIFGWVMCIMLPFFIWLDWKGWFRSDPLEEIVGLDTSYHGGLALLAHADDGVRPEYITAFKEHRKQQQNLRKRRTMESTGHTSPVHSQPDLDDDDDEEEEEDMEHAV